MERRRFVLRLFETLVLGGLFLLAGCGKGEKRPAFGNQERLWDLASGQEKIEEPIELAYSKETPALFRDASMGKADPSFVPKVGGG
ncbi:MAG: hypothetical protein A2170_14500 [Deltaproteobacteria bacterium RBG_13_53_10]|nr:MAG: hypothetical protein A2170_14500 [Deltaproteobacteria bacterium RBG_13_53_10]